MEFEPSDPFGDEHDDSYGLYSGECAGCDLWMQINDIGLCEGCAGKLDRDMIRQRDWAYSPTAWACREGKREQLRTRVIKKYGAKLELIAPEGRSKKRRRR